MEDGIGTLDGATWEDVEAVRRLFRQRRQAFPPEFRELAREVLARSPDPSLRHDALNVLASAAVIDGRDDDASALFRKALDATWGSASHAERVACVNLAMIVTRQRRLIEAFALSRRACDIALAVAEPLAACLSHAQLAKTLLELGDDEGFRAAVEMAEAHRPDMDDTLRGWVPHLLASLQAEVALQDGDAPRARRLLAQALDRPEVPADVERMGRAQSLRRLGEPAAALAVVRHALAEGHTEAHYELRFAAEELLCLADLGEAEAETLRERAAAWLERMASEGRECGSASWRMRVGETVGDALRDHGGSRFEALQAYELAAVAALQRSWESKLFFQEFPQLEKLPARDVARLEAHAVRFHEKHLELAAAIERLVREGARFGASRADAAGAIRGEAGSDACGEDGFFVAICAWCSRVRGPERTWIALGELVTRSRDLALTHGICQPCTATLLQARGGAPESVVA